TLNFPRVVNSADDENIINLLDIGFVNTYDFKFPVKRTLVFLGKNGNDAVFYLKMKVTCYFCGNANSVIEAFFSDVWNFPGHQKFLESRAVKIFSDAFKNNSGKIML